MRIQCDHVCLRRTLPLLAAGISVRVRGSVSAPSRLLPLLGLVRGRLRYKILGRLFLLVFYLRDLIFGFL